MPVCVPYDVTTGHTEIAAKICIFEKVHWHCIKCGTSNSFINDFAWWVCKYIKQYTIIRIQALGVVIRFNYPVRNGNDKTTFCIYVHAFIIIK